MEENNKREKTRHIKFSDFKMSEYLEKNMRTSLSTFIFSIRSKTLDLKDWQPWKYKDLLCVKCQLHPETIEHFWSCNAYGNMSEMNLRDIFGNDIEKQTKIGIFLEKRFKIREKIIKQQEDGQAPTSGSSAPGTL